MTTASDVIDVYSPYLRPLNPNLIKMTMNGPSACNSLPVCFKVSSTSFKFYPESSSGSKKTVFQKLAVSRGQLFFSGQSRVRFNMIFFSHT